MLTDKTNICSKCGLGIGICLCHKKDDEHSYEYNKMLKFIEWVAEGKRVGSTIQSHNSFLVRSLAIEILSDIEKAK